MTLRKPLTPIDIQSVQFRRAFRGFDREEVGLFLQGVAESFQAVSLENQTLLKEVEHLKASLEEYHRREDVLREALYTAQKVSGEVKAQAAREAQSIVQGAEVKGETIIKQAQLRTHEIERAVVDLRMERSEALEGLRTLIRRIQNVIDGVTEQQERDNVASLGKETP